MTLPNFFIAGAPKAGTDELYYHLDQHPQIYMSPLKEPCFFSHEVRIENFDERLQPGARASTESLRVYLDSGAPSKRFGGIVTSSQDYERLFCRAQKKRAIGEGSVCYLWSASAASAIASIVPQARIIIVLMDPAERAFRQYLKSLSDGNVTHSFRTHLQTAFQDKRQKLTIYHPFLEFGCYAEQVRRYLAHFPREQLHISLYEDRATDPAGWFRSILRFLEVREDFVPSPVDIPSTPHFRRFDFVKLKRLHPALGGLMPGAMKSAMKKVLYAGARQPALAREERAALVEFYRDDILDLQHILGRDLAAWLRY